MSMRHFTLVSPMGLPRFCRFDGFSLIEVVVAIGIVAFALTALLGILPIGLNVARESAAQTSQAHILQQIASELAKVDSGLPGYLAQSQYYDVDGKRLKSTENSSVVYTTSFTLFNPVYPGVVDSGFTDINRRLGRVVVTIRKPGDTAATGFKAFLPVFNYGGTP